MNKAIIKVEKRGKNYKTETPSCKISLYCTVLNVLVNCVFLFMILSYTRRWHCWKACVLCIWRSCAGSGSITHWLCTLSSLHFTRSCSSQTLICTQWLRSELIHSVAQYTEYTVTACVNKYTLISEGDNYIKTDVFLCKCSFIMWSTMVLQIINSLVVTVFLIVWTFQLYKGSIL